jgi:hypothetical protein
MIHWLLTTWWGAVCTVEIFHALGIAALLVIAEPLVRCGRSADE